MSFLNWFHRHRYDLRETRTDGRYLVCSCGAAVPMLKRDTPVTVTPPSHETMKARYQMLISTEINVVCLPSDALKNAVIKDIQ